jgi:thiazolinyl imide reductase
MSGETDWVPRVVVCGTGFGRVYLSALRRQGMPFELTGILARGSARSQACARHYQVPLYTEAGQLPATDIACVVVNAGLNGGRGAELAQDLLARGVHVLQEHPLLGTELSGCLRQARRSGVVYHLNTNYVHVDAVACFIGAARRLLDRQAPLFIDALSNFGVLYTLADILGQALGGVRPWSLTASQQPPGRAAEVLRTVNGMLRGIPATLRIQNQIHPGQRDSGPHIMHRVTLATEGGNLLLANTQGPVLWSPKLHMPADYPDAVSIDASSAAHLDLPSVTCLTGSAVPSYRQVIGDQWPQAAGRALLELRRAIIEDEDPLPRGQYHLALCELTADITAQLGPPELATAGPPEIMQANALVCGAAGTPAGQPSSQLSPAVR